MLLPWCSGLTMCRSVRHVSPSKGKNTNAQFGFYQYPGGTDYKTKPSHMAVCFDTSVPARTSYRFCRLQNQPAETPEDISAAVPDIRKN